MKLIFGLLQEVQLQTTPNIIHNLDGKNLKLREWIQTEIQWIWWSIYKSVYGRQTTRLNNYSCRFECEHGYWNMDSTQLSAPGLLSVAHAPSSRSSRFSTSAVVFWESVQQCVSIYPIQMIHTKIINLFWTCSPLLNDNAVLLQIS